MNRLLFLFCFTFCVTALFAQNCYMGARSMGIRAFNQKNYTEAMDHFKRANICKDKPEKNDLRKWLKRCNDSININTEPLLPDTIEVVSGTPEEIQEKLNIEMIFVEGGSFVMGCMSEQDEDCFKGEFPQHDVKLSDFYIGRYEVTQKQWQSVMGTNPSKKKGSDLPVENVTWNEVQEFIRKLNSLTGKRYRLPTEAEWEYAARGGNKSSGYKYSGSNNIDEVAWYVENSNSKTQPVGKKKPNELDIYDMNGNVFEWCEDWFNFNFYQKNKSQGVVTNPKSLSNSSTRVIRGGSWQNYAWNCRVSNRSDNGPDVGDGRIGFRLACSK